MSFEEEFDKIIKQKADEAGFAFDEQNWEKVSKQLDAERKGAGLFVRKRALMIGILFLLFSTVGLMLYFGDKTGAGPIADTSALNDISTAKQSAPEQIQNAGNLNNEETKIVSNISAEAKPQQKTVVVAQNSASDLVLMSTAKMKTHDFTSSAKMTKKQAALGHAPLETKPENEHLSLPTEGQSGLNPAVAVSNPGESPMADQIDEATAPKAAENSTEYKMVTSGAGEISEGFLLEQIAPIQTKMFAATEEKNFSPSVPLMKNFYDEDYYRLKKHKTHFLNLEAGTAYLMGWQTKNGTDGKGLNGFGGLNYGFYLTKKIAVSAGLQYYNIAHIKQVFYTGSKSEYGFGVVTTNTLITAQSLYYASVPLKLSYAMDAHNQFGAGVNFGYLVNAKNNVQIYSTSEVGLTPISNSKKTGAYEGIATTNLLFSAFYKAYLSRRLALNGELVYGVTDLFINTKTIKNNETAVGFRLSLQYMLFDK